MKLIIDIDNDVYNRIKNGYPEPNDCYKCQDEVLYGKPYEERPQGKWISNSYTSCINRGKYCSLCCKIVEFSENFCPNCGADMRGGAE